jgi:hypothetical protein
MTQEEFKVAQQTYTRLMKIRHLIPHMFNKHIYITNTSEQNCWMF